MHGLLLDEKEIWDSRVCIYIVIPLNKKESSVMVKKPGKVESFNSVISDEETEKSIDDEIDDPIVEALQKTAVDATNEIESEMDDDTQSIIDSVLTAEVSEDGNSVCLRFNEPVSFYTIEEENSGKTNESSFTEDDDQVKLVLSEETETIDEDGQKTIHIHNTFEVVQAGEPSEPVKVYEDGLRSWTRDEFAQFMERSERQEVGASTDDLPVLDEEQQALFDIFCECQAQYRRQNPHLSKMDGGSFMQ